MQTKTLITIVALVAIVATIVFLESGKVRPSGDGFLGINLAKSDMTETLEEKRKKYESAKDISTPDGFINTEEFTLAPFIGEKVILVDFWTYSCINCQRTLPYLQSWHEKYADDGLLIVGVHTPEFEFEKEYENVARAVEKWGVTYPVVLDNDYSTWSAYRNRYWPRKYLVDVDGFIVYDHIGEGGYEETESKIVEALNELAARKGVEGVEMEQSGPENVDSVDFGRVRTPETYLGASRIQYLANLPSTSCLSDGVCTFTPSGTPAFNTFELAGEWKIEKEEAVLSGDSGAILIHFDANKVNLVAGAENGARAEIYLDGEKISADVAGAHVENGVVTFREHDLYNLVDLRGDYGKHILEIRFLDGGVSAFAFTFG